MEGKHAWPYYTGQNPAQVICHTAIFCAATHHQRQPNRPQKHTKQCPTGRPHLWVAQDSNQTQKISRLQQAGIPEASLCYNSHVYLGTFIRKARGSCKNKLTSECHGWSEHLACCSSDFTPSVYNNKKKILLADSLTYDSIDAHLCACLRERPPWNYPQTLLAPPLPSKFSFGPLLSCGCQNTNYGGILI